MDFINFSSALNCFSENKRKISHMKYKKIGDVYKLCDFTSFFFSIKFQLYSKNNKHIQSRLDQGLESLDTWINNFP